MVGCFNITYGVVLEEKNKNSIGHSKGLYHFLRKSLLNVQKKTDGFFFRILFDRFVIDTTDHGTKSRHPKEVFRIMSTKIRSQELEIWKVTFYGESENNGLRFQVMRFTLTMTLND
jgi:hypothetical protein